MALYLSDNPDSVRHYLSGNPDHVRHYVNDIPGSARYYASGNPDGTSKTIHCARAVIPLRSPNGSGSSPPIQEPKNFSVAHATTLTLAAPPTFDLGDIADQNRPPATPPPSPTRKLADDLAAPNPVIKPNKNLDPDADPNPRQPGALNLTLPLGHKQQRISHGAYDNIHRCGGVPPKIRVTRLPDHKATAIRDILSRYDPDISASLQQPAATPTTSERSENGTSFEKCHPPTPHTNIKPLGAKVEQANSDSPKPGKAVTHRYDYHPYKNGSDRKISRFECIPCPHVSSDRPSYVWKETHRAHNKKYHAEHGNGSATKLISKLTVDGLPKLAKEADDPAVFMEYAIDMRGWAVMNNITEFTVGPAVATPHGEAAEARATRLAKHAEGVRYICASIVDQDLRSTVAVGAGSPPLGPAAYLVLQAQFLQGTDEQPTIMAIVDSMHLRRDQSVVAFRSRFAKFALALDPQPSARILSQKFCKAVTAHTGDMYMQCAISSITDPAAQDDFGAYSALLTRLCTQQRQIDDANKVAATYSAMQTATTKDDEDDQYIKTLEDRIASLERRLECVLTPEAACYDDDDDDREHDRGRRVEQEEATPTSVDSHQTAVDHDTDEAVGYVDTYF